MLLGSIQLSSGAADQALKSFSAAVKAQPKDVIGYRALADLYVSHKNYDEAIGTVRAGIEQQPDMLPLHMILASILERKADYEAAISEYEFMLARQPANLILANNLASLLLDHRTDKANLKRAQSLAAILRKSDIPQFKDTLGWANYHRATTGPRSPCPRRHRPPYRIRRRFVYHLGMGYIATDQPAKASEQLKKALELAPSEHLAQEIRAAIKKTGS